jgi:hypothetical protein
LGSASATIRRISFTTDGFIEGVVQNRGGLAALTTLERSYISHLSSVDCTLRLATASSRLPH